MDLSKHVVIRSKFGAQAGGTPGQYIRTYTSRENATEALTPYSDQNLIAAFYRSQYERRQANQAVVEKAGTRDGLKVVNEHITPQSSRLFGSEGYVYSTQQFEEAIEKTEGALERGHTLITPVISFTHAYLVENKVVPEDFPEPREEKGEDYRGYVDQLKLRRSITEGMKEMTRSMQFVDPIWTGSIHLDTQNVHCHVTLIEGGPHYEVPESRRVRVPKKEWTLQPSGQMHESVIKDERGRIVYEDLGERGKINQQARDQFRQGLNRELVYLRDYTPYISKDNPHYTMEQQYSGLLELSNTKLSLQLMRVYQHLPEDRGLWKYPSTNPRMLEANREAERFTELLKKDHPLALGLHQYKRTLKAQAKHIPSEHQRLYEQTKEQDLHDILINRLYDRLRKTKVVSKEEPLPKDTRDETYVREVVYTEQLKHSMIQEQMLKDLLADAHQGNSKLQEGTVRSLSLEYRLRAYSSRFDAAKEEAGLYDYLKEEYETFEEEGRVSSDSKPMYEFYEVESRYYNGVMDKYRYLLNQSFISKVNVDGAFYALPKGPLEDVSSLETYVESRDWESWFEENEGVLDYQCDQLKLNGESTLDFQVNQYQNVSDMLFEHSEDLELSERDQYRLNVVRSVSELAYEQVQRQQHVSKERFDEVKTYDLPKLTYDLNVGVDRHVSPAAKESFNDLNEERRIKTARALDYLKATQQEAGPAYRYYVGSLKEREFDRL